MSEQPEYDIAIIGYGPTGVTAANLLGQRGLSVVVLERDADIYGRARAISTDEEVMRVWQSVGLSDALQRDMLPGGVVAFVDDAGRPFIEVEPSSRGAGHPPQQFIYQPAVDTTLREGVARFPNVTVLTGHECLKVIATGDRASILAARLDDDVFVRTSARYVIAADGGSSAIRGQLGVGYQGTTFTERWVVIDTKVLEDWPGSSRLRFHGNPARPTVDCPTPLGHHRWEFPVRDDEDENVLVTHDAIWEVLRGQGITPEKVEILRAVVYSHHVRVADRWRVGRVFLAGDAAHAMPPWIGQGMASGVRDVANLCWKLAGVVEGTLPESALDSYQTEREPHVRETTNRAVFTGRVITERRPAVAAARNHLVRLAMRVPAARRWMVETKWIPDARYADGFLSDVAHRARGWQIPQPLVADGDGNQQRLDDVLAGAWCVLTRDGMRQTPWTSVGTPTVRVLPPGSQPAAGAIVDTRGELTAWMARRDAGALAVRPDGFVYAAAAAGRPLPPPPNGLHPSRSSTADAGITR
ncbi:bifunctional 3-(3-hydroxy-phenyl)propionate/3-hydroxycinnamic acid hydroxylase [Rhodococcoides corynebacterioides]|uniref:bifunctional 3-(3-hydroxy-phenyl)propionate/3-hydroxycinnamic acid hydroxylase n=1 Tax=Rhodococcoides corynebacterioides TaxID=53972 RepID=UPI001C9B00D6|nr:bifunctional 3-(3-hydroxy-phenyl)propionate/3-hydroxycinnamic acid hydroxylase [Rhodococcus corynebacterioides]MBY6364629.1 bifunctional 3-(3-hydroxy-phenyl)propionate/3-hydroxycinnamic acid hydroxylase [Rhodococcus corynebacterioides]